MEFEVDVNLLLNCCLQRQDVQVVTLINNALSIVSGDASCNRQGCFSPLGKEFAAISFTRKGICPHDFFNPPKQTPFACLTGAAKASELQIQKTFDSQGKKEWLNDRELQQIFNEIDRNRDGNIQIEEMQFALSHLNLPAGREYIDDLFQQYDQNRDEIISWSEFKQYVRGKQKAIIKAFQELDKDNSGVLSESDILSSLRSAGLPANKEDAQRMIELLDDDRNNVISHNEFAKYMCMLPAAQINNRNALFVWVDSADWIKGMDSRLCMIPPKMTYKRLVAGGVAGALSRTVVAPFERLRTIIMINQGTSLWQGVKTMWADGGFLGMFKGNLPTVIKVFPASAVQFAAYDSIKDVFLRMKGEELGAGDKLLAGCIAGAASGSVSYPLDTLRTLLQMPGQQKNLFQVAADVVERQGLGGLYRGFGTSVISDIIGTGLGFMCYETGNRIWREQFGSPPTPGQKGIIGGTAAIFVMTATMPFEVIMRRLQAQSSIAGAQQAYQGMFDAFRRILQEEGIRTFYSGSLSSYLKVVPSVGAMYFMYDYLAKNWAIEGIRRYRREKPATTTA